jgi:hypothetical protein
MNRRPERQQLWHELERSLAALVESLSAELKPKDKEILIDFIENREYGVALEGLHLLAVEQSIQLTLPQQQEIQRLAQLMSIDLDQIGK